MNKYLSFALFFFLGISALAQEPHMREPKSVDELLREKRPNEFRALKEHELYLVINKYGRTKTHKRFIGEEFTFISREDVRFNGSLAAVTDSTFTLYYFDETEDRYLHRMFYLKDVAIALKRNLKPGLEYKLSPVIAIPFALDWIYFSRPPWQNVNSLFYLAGIEAARVALTNRHKFSNRMKIGNRYRLVVFQY